MALPREKIYTIKEFFDHNIPVCIFRDLFIKIADLL